MTQTNLGNTLRNLGDRETGTKRLEQAVNAHRAALQVYTRESAPFDWAAAQNNLGNALSFLGEREDGTERLKEAVDAFQETLRVHTRESAPFDWAATQNNLGGCPVEIRRAGGWNRTPQEGRRRLPRHASGAHPRTRAPRLGHDAEQPR